MRAVIALVVFVVATLVAASARAQTGPTATPPPPTPVPQLPTSPDEQSSGTGGATASAAGVGVGGLVALRPANTGDTGDEGGTGANSGGGGSSANASTSSSGGGGASSGPAVASSLVICETVGAVNNNCHTSPIDAPGEGGGVNPPEGQIPVFDPEPAPVAAPYVPSLAEIDATIVAAYDNVEFPDLTLRTAPPGDLDAPLITQLATFLWVDPAQWQPITATAEIPGYLSVTATATPTSMWWSGGETGPIECYPPGIEWYPGAPEECTMTYKTSSATNDHELRLSVTWQVTFTCSAYCSGGDLAPVTNDHVRPVRVAEIQSIVTSGG